MISSIRVKRGVLLLFAWRSAEIILEEISLERAALLYNMSDWLRIIDHAVGVALHNASRSLLESVDIASTVELRTISGSRER